MTENRTHRYHRSDFGPLPAMLEHMDLFLTFGNDSVVVTNRLRVRAIQALSSLRLDARDLEILSISSVGDQSVPLDYNYLWETNVLEIALPEPVSAGGVFSVETTTCCRPSDNILEGIYKDTTPAGCPQQ
ncbi:MAG: DUF3458 domain-containing protein, partial [Candidatus Pacebacteria bacterium]|nr:DUF3458 domain-containing protein [Candidatus Paceibacterota bacterium]